MDAIESLFAEFKHLEGELVNGTVRSIDDGVIHVDLGKVEASLCEKDAIPGEPFQPDDPVCAYLEEVNLTEIGMSIRLSRTSPMLLARLIQVTSRKLRRAPSKYGILPANTTPATSHVMGVRR